MSERPLAGRRAVVTGASGGIGLATARRLAAQGAEVAMVARREEVLRAEAARIGPAAVALPGDVTDAAAVERLARTVAERWPEGADVLVSAAGVFEPAPLRDTSPASFRAALDVNLLAPFLLLRALLPPMLDRGAGHVVIVGSVADRAIFPENAAYAATKHGQRAMLEVLREELRGTGVRTTLVSPGPTDTPLWDPLDPDNRPGYVKRAAMLPADAVAEAIAWAVSRPPRVVVDELRLSPG